MANMLDISTPDGVVSVPEIEFSPDQASYFTKDLGPERATSFLAENAVSEISQQFPDLFNYESLKDGTAKLFDLDPDNKNIPSNERGLTDEAILKQFTNLEEVGFFSGFGRELLKSGPSAAGFYAGAKTGAALTSGIPPVNPLLVGVKFGVPLVTGTLGAFATYEAGDDLANFVFGDESLPIPSHRAAYEAGRTTAGGLAWLPMPFLISKNVSFGASTYLKNLDEIIKTGSPQTGLQRSKPPLSTKLISGVETLLNKTGKEFKDKPKRMAFLEGLSLSGATVGAYTAENIAPEQAAVRIPFEIAGGIGPQLAFGTVVKNFENIKNAIKKPFSAEGRKEIIQGSGLGKEKRQLDAVRRVREILNEQGDDIEGLIKALDDDSLTKQLDDINLTAGQKTGNPTLMAIEARLASDSQGLGKTRNEAHLAANKAIRNLINALVATGDKTAIQEAAKLQKLRFDGYLAEQLALRSDRVLNAFKAVYKDKPINNKKLSENLFEVTGSALQEARTQEKRLYRDIGNLEITSFLNTEGNPVDTPNFIRYFERNMPTTNEAFADFLKDLGPLNNFVARKKIELGLEDLTPGATTNRIAEFDKVIEQIKARGVLPRRTDNLVLNVVDQARKDLDLGELDQLDAGELTSLLSTIRSNKPVQATDVFKGGTTRQAAGERQRRFEQVKNQHKDALELVNTYRKRKIEEANVPVTEATDELQPLTVNEIRDMRSLALEKGRALTASGEANKARIAYGFAEALLDDLNSAPKGVNAAFDTARAYSKSLNDTYTRAFAGNILSKSKTGAERIPPEILHTRLFVGGADPSYLRITQIENIGNFAKEQGLEGAEDTISTIHGTLDQLIRNARAEAFDPETGAINVKKLKDWNRKNADLLDKFPGLKNDLEEAETANVLLTQWVDKDKRIQKIINSQKTYRNLTGYENPTRAVLEAINSKFPTKALNSMIRVAKDNPEALSGLKSSMLDAALNKAGGTSETFSPRALYETLFTKIPNAIDINTTLMNIMKKNNVITEGEANNFKKLITEMVKLEAAESAGKLGEVIEGTGAIMDFYLRITGSAIGTRLQGLVFGGQGPGALVAAGAGSKALRNLFNQIPESMKTDVMTEVMENPQLLASLLRKTKDQQQKLNIAGKIKKILAKAGYITIGKPVKESFRTAPFAIREIQEEEIDMTDPTFENVGKQSSVNLPKEGFPTTQKAMVPPSGLNTRLAANVGTVPQAAPNPNQRQQFASLFPNDPISGLINAQQPTRLMAEGGAVPPRQVEIKGQPHMLAYITPQEGGILQLLGGSGRPGPMGIPSFYPGEGDATAGVDGPSGDPGGGAASDPSGSSSSGASSGGETGYSGSITDAMSATSPTGMTGTGGIGGYGPSVAGVSTSMGLEDSIAGMAGVMGGLTSGLSGYENVQGSVNYSPVQNVPYDPLGKMKNMMNRHARSSLTRGYSPEFSIDPTTGNITSVTGKGGPGMSVPGIGGLMSTIGANLGMVTTTGYAGKGVDDEDIGGNENDGIVTLRPQQEFQEAIRLPTARELYLANPNKYRLFG
jgi:hypothetical protein